VTPSSATPLQSLSTPSHAVPSDAGLSLHGFQPPPAAQAPGVTA
jgi:hypothetical protein